MKIPYCERSCYHNEELFHFMRLERAVSLLAIREGYDGDSFAEPAPKARTVNDIYRASELFFQLPANLRNWDRDLALRMCRAVVYGSHSRGQQSNLDLPTYSHSTTSLKLKHERIQQRSRRASA